MTEFAENRHIGTCQEKLAPPRSLQEEGEDAQRIWNVIVKRYPKAAPLICEMEVAIERAENLLHNFRKAPNTSFMENETPSSIHMSNSDESSMMLTANSGSQISSSEESYNEDRVDLSSSSTSSNDLVGSISSRKLLTVDESINTDTVENSMAENTCKMNGDHHSITSQKQEPPIFVETTGNLILEEPGKAGDVKDNNSTKFNEKRDAPSHPYSPSNAMLKKSPIKEAVTKVVHSIEKDPSGIPDDKILLPSKLGNIRSRTTKIPQTEITLRSKKGTKSASNVSPVGVTITNIDPIESENVRTNSKKDNRDENSSETSLEKTPVTMLKNYAEQCNEKLDFNVIRNKLNSYEIKCSFAGYSAKSMGHPKSSVEIKLATLILRNIADDQMDEKVMTKLKPFSTKQMRYVVALDTEGQPENAMRKLYKLCLEKDAPKPYYSAKLDYASEGVKYTVECTALNKVATGTGVREETAKIAAADKLYTQLLAEQKQNIK